MAKVKKPKKQKEKKEKGRGRGFLAGFGSRGSLEGVEKAGHSSFVPSKRGTANYGPLPSFSTPSVSVKKYSNPTLADVSTQMGRVLAKVTTIDKALKDQLEFQKFEYKENARVQREINAEGTSPEGASPVPDLSGIDMLGLQEAIGRLITALDDASSSMGGGILPIPGGGSTTSKVKPKSTAKPRDYSLVKNSEALDKNGKIKKGYEAVIDRKNNRIIGYRRDAKLGVKSAAKQAGKTSGYWGKFGSKIANFSAPVSLAKSAIGGAGRLTMKIAGKLLTPAIIAYESYEAWKEIEALSPTLSASERKNAIAKIVGDLVGSIGLIWAGATLGSMAASVVAPGIGTLGGFVAGAAGGLVADYFFGDDVEDLVNMLVDKVMPVEKEKVAKPISSKKTMRKAAETAAIHQTAKSAPTSTKEKKLGLTVGDMINKIASEIGVNTDALYSIALLLNKNLNIAKDISETTGSQIFDLTDQQWNQVRTRYGASYPALKAGKNDPKAAITAAALLTKESEDFLTQNNIESSTDNLVATYLVGNDGLKDLMKANPDEQVSKIVPEAVKTRPELFSTEENKPMKVGEFFKRTYDIDLEPVSKTNQSSNLSSTSEATKTPETKAQATPVSSSSSTPEPAATPVSTPPAASTGAGISSESTSSDSTSSTVSAPSIPDAARVENTETTSVGDTINTASADVQNMELADTGSAVIPNATTSDGSPVILPSSSAGYSGTGNVPDPLFDLGSVESELYFTPTMTMPAYAGVRA